MIEAGGVGNPGNIPGTPTAAGNLNSTDVDNPPDAWSLAVATPTPGANGYVCSYTLTATGAWTYTLNNSNADRTGAERRATR